MASTTIEQITLVYRGETHQFTTVSQAAHFLRQVRIKVGWFHTVKAAVDLVGHNTVMETHHLKGNKFHIMQALEAFEGGRGPSNA